MSIIDEIKKRQFWLGTWDKTNVVHVSDIEEILKRSCKWKKENDEVFYRTNCDKYFLTRDFASLGFVYCPYCGKLIEESKEEKDNG